MLLLTTVFNKEEYQKVKSLNHNKEISFYYCRIKFRW